MQLQISVWRPLCIVGSWVLSSQERVTCFWSKDINISHCILYIKQRQPSWSLYTYYMYGYHSIIKIKYKSNVILKHLFKRVIWLSKSLLYVTSDSDRKGSEPEEMYCFFVCADAQDKFPGGQWGRYSKCQLVPNCIQWLSEKNPWWMKTSQTQLDAC